jgi:hypothetical protein
MRGASRFALEAVYLAALTAALAFARLRPAEVVAFMAGGWLAVALFEWGALRERPHFASGLPPRWRLPRRRLPPPRPLEPVGRGAPAGSAAPEEATWVASPALRARWPVAAEATAAHAPPGAGRTPPPEPAPAPAPEPPPAPAGPAASTRRERHRLDPFEEPPRRRLRRRSPAGPAEVEVPARPAGAWPLPGPPEAP